jgi:AAA family ATP:ADP antiporter
MATAMMCAGAITAQFVGGKATRDTLLLASLGFTAIPKMVIATSVVSILLVTANSKWAGRISPGRVVPLSFAVSAILFLVEWLMSSAAPRAAAVVVYLHISALGPVLGSGFWLIASERFDPRTAKKRFGQIAGAGTVGGLFGAALAYSVAAAAMLPILAALHFISAGLVRSLAVQTGPRQKPASTRRPEAKPRSGWRILADAPYLRNLAVLVLVSTMGAALLDYLFKAQALGAFGRGDQLRRFFAIYYAAVSVVTFVVQVSSSRYMLERFGLALTTSTPSIALAAGSLGALVIPGFGVMTAARGAESVCRGSVFRAGYELFYTPIPSAEKRAAKSIIDVAIDRLGDAVGGGLVQAVVLIAPALQYRVILGIALMSSAAAMLAASRLNRGYIQTLENSLLNRGVEIDFADVEDGTTRTLMMRTLGPIGLDIEPRREREVSSRARGAPTAALPTDPVLQDIVGLRSHDRDRVAAILRRDEGMAALLVPHVIPLLAWDPVAPDAVFALTKVAEERVGELVDALIDPNQEFAVRRRLARVFAVCVSQRAADGLVLGLDDLRFEVRYQSGRSLAAIVDKNPLVRTDPGHIFRVVLREATVGRPVWESRRLLDEWETSEAAPSSVDLFVRDRASQSLAHVFTLLSLVLPREPLQIAFRSLHTEDQNLRGTALEYLEGVLPPAIRERLWPFLEDRRPSARRSRPGDEVLADLLRSNESIVLKLEELKQLQNEPVSPVNSGDYES